MQLVTRAMGAAARHLGRPELLAAVDSTARLAHREAIATNAVLACALRADGTYVDVGANRGQVLREAVRIAPRGRHIAFEPIPALAAGLADAFPRVAVRQMALGACVEVAAEFCHFTQLDGWSGLRRSPQISDERGRPQFIATEVSTLDAELGDLAPDVLKIDVEGAELAVLQGGRSLLSRARPVVIFEHVAHAAALYGAASGTLWELLTDLGYEIFTVTGEGPFTRAGFVAGSGAVNWLATPGVGTREDSSSQCVAYSIL